MRAVARLDKISSLAAFTWKIANADLLLKFAGIMAASEKNLVLIPVDESVHSERAFDCEYRSTLLYCRVGKAA